MSIQTKSLMIQLTYDKKLQRWLQILALLEDSLTISGKEIAQQIATTRRTLITDIKELNEQFATTMQIVGDEQGYSLRLMKPQEYYQQKRQLLAKELLFVWLDGIFQGQKRTIIEWANLLDTNISTFHRYKKQLEATLADYQVSLAKEEIVALQGEEIAIRRFFYSFYYEQAFSPESLLESKTRYEAQTPIVHSQSSWACDQKKCQNWAIISYQRQQTGDLLPEKSTAVPEMIQALAKEIQLERQPFGNQREAATIFLLSLEELRFIDPKLQQRFVHSFAPVELQESLAAYSQQQLLDQPTLLFLGTWVYLLDQLEILPLDGEPLGKNENPPILAELFSSEGIAYFIGLIEQWQKQKEQLCFEVVVKWGLLGPAVVQQWIKEAFKSEAQKQCITLNEEEDSFVAEYLPKVQITNTAFAPHLYQVGIQLSEVPAQEEIEKVCQELKKYLAALQQEKSAKKRAGYSD